MIYYNAQFNTLRPNLPIVTIVPVVFCVTYGYIL